MMLGIVSIHQFWHILWYGKRKAPADIYKIITLYTALVEEIIKLKRAVAGGEILREPL